VRVLWSGSESARERDREEERRRKSKKEENVKKGREREKKESMLTRKEVGDKGYSADMCVWVGLGHSEGGRGGRVKDRVGTKVKLSGGAGSYRDMEGQEKTKSPNQAAATIDKKGSRGSDSREWWWWVEGSDGGKDGLLCAA
jgi:hypothetical protein